MRILDGSAHSATDSDDTRLRENECVELMVDCGIKTFIQSGKQILRREDGAVVALNRRGGLSMPLRFPYDVAGS